MDETALSEADVAFLAKVLLDRCALVLEPGKESLIKVRLMPLLQRHGLSNLAELMAALRAAMWAPLVTEVVEAMVTNETSFFRDIHPFETLRKSVLPELIERRRPTRQLNIWCAASSSGQEPYSIALVLKEYFPQLEGWRINLTATDISRPMLERSKAGRYNQVEVNRGLPTALLLKWFRQEGATWLLDEKIRNSVSFSQMNLARMWPVMPTWDLIFLRNVMIYFENATKRTILDRASRVLAKDGYLLLGGSETTLNLSDAYGRVENLRSGFYRLKG